jgi:hypothetical protein
MPGGDKGCMARHETKKSNEINACNALIRMLRKVAGVEYELEYCPDEGASEGKDVDFILKSTCSGVARMAVEHTVIPKGLYDYVKRFYERAEGISKLCEGKIPADRFFYIAAPQALIDSFTKDRRGKASQRRTAAQRRNAFDESLALWISEQSQQLQEDESVQYRFESHNITLVCGGSHPQWNGRVGRIPEAPADITRFQKEAFDHALQHGLDKFSKYKCNSSENFKTILLLEDVTGLRHERIAEELASSERDRIDESVDYIIVLQSLENQMIVGYVWKENQTWHRFIPGNRRFTFNT